jgi:hypothetical protein
MTEVKVVQGTDEWLNIRTKKITGSNFNLLMRTDGQKNKIESVIKNNIKYEGKPDKQKPMPPTFSDGQLTYLYSVIAECFTGIGEYTPTTFAMQRGTDLEPEARQEYSNKHMVNVRECGIYTDDELIGVSPDGETADEKALEIKCPGQKAHVEYMLDPVKLFNKYKWQLIAEIWAMELHKGVIISYHPDFPTDKQIVEYEYEPTIEDFTELTERLEECKQFVMDAVK